ncbi:BrnT family toxin [Nitratiruptor tergarcus]|uniref:Uncharacterized protein n=1 Tax=Nitratiruptor tergarcus DSM 16512 TaxID=1069081 RepID=A0A1W1WQ26_9BACT|nr:BrnT family toxin [Nitratiruptor tergarcus]SMC08397.1 hypothetical protein SAMN05660197_0147 [Nitratiruptor tergarcus DSM 16512]
MHIEYDPNKSKANKQKHGLDFEEARELFENDDSLIVPAKIIDGEERYALIGYLDGKCYVAIFTYRGENIRIISVRRCRKNEERNYEEYNG